MDFHSGNDVHPWNQQVGADDFSYDEIGISMEPPNEPTDDQSNMSGLDLYTDMVIRDSEEAALSMAKLKEEKLSFQSQLDVASREVTRLTAVNEALVKENQVLKSNISVLLKTAKMELQRKEREITELRESQIGVDRNKNFTTMTPRTRRLPTYKKRMERRRQNGTHHSQTSTEGAVAGDVHDKHSDGDNDPKPKTHETLFVQRHRAKDRKLSQDKVIPPPKEPAASSKCKPGVKSRNLEEIDVLGGVDSTKKISTPETNLVSKQSEVKFVQKSMLDEKMESHTLKSDIKLKHVKEKESVVQERTKDAKYLTQNQGKDGVTPSLLRRLGKNYEENHSGSLEASPGQRDSSKSTERYTRCISPERLGECSSRSHQSKRSSHKTCRDISSGKTYDSTSSSKSRDRSSRSKSCERTTSSKSRDRSSRSKSHERTTSSKSRDRSSRSKSHERTTSSKSRERSSSKSCERTTSSKSRDRSSRSKSQERTTSSKSRDRLSRSKSHERTTSSKSRDRSSRSKSRERTTSSKSRDRSSRSKSHERTTSSKSRNSSSRSKSHERTSTNKSRDRSLSKKDIADVSKHKVSKYLGSECALILAHDRHGKCKTLSAVKGKASRKESPNHKRNHEKLANRSEKSMISDNSKCEAESSSSRKIDSGMHRIKDAESRMKERQGKTNLEFSTPIKGGVMETMKSEHDEKELCRKYRDSAKERRLHSERNHSRARERISSIAKESVAKAKATLNKRSYPSPKKRHRHESKTPKSSALCFDGLTDWAERKDSAMHSDIIDYTRDSRSKHRGIHDKEREFEASKRKRERRILSSSSQDDCNVDKKRKVHSVGDDTFDQERLDLETRHKHEADEPTTRLCTYEEGHTVLACGTKYPIEHTSSRVSVLHSDAYDTTQSAVSILSVLNTENDTIADVELAKEAGKDFLKHKCVEDREEGELSEGEVVSDVEDMDRVQGSPENKGQQSTKTVRQRKKRDKTKPEDFSRRHRTTEMGSSATFEGALSPKIEIKLKDHTLVHAKATEGLDEVQHETKESKQHSRSGSTSKIKKQKRRLSSDGVEQEITKKPKRDVLINEIGTEAQETMPEKEDTPEKDCVSSDHHHMVVGDTTVVLADHVENGNKVSSGEFGSGKDLQEHDSIICVAPIPESICDSGDDIKEEVGSSSAVTVSVNESKPGDVSPRHISNSTAGLSATCESTDCSVEKPDSDMNVSRGVLFEDLCLSSSMDDTSYLSCVDQGSEKPQSFLNITERVSKLDNNSQDVAGDVPDNEIGKGIASTSNREVSPESSEKEGNLCENLNVCSDVFPADTREGTIFASRGSPRDGDGETSLKQQDIAKSVLPISEDAVLDPSNTCLPNTEVLPTVGEHTEQPIESDVEHALEEDNDALSLLAGSDHEWTIQETKNKGFASLDLSEGDAMIQNNATDDGREDASMLMSCEWSNLDLYDSSTKMDTEHQPGVPAVSQPTLSEDCARDMDYAREHSDIGIQDAEDEKHVRTLTDVKDYDEELHGSDSSKDHASQARGFHTVEGTEEVLFVDKLSNHDGKQDVKSPQMEDDFVECKETDSVGKNSVVAKEELASLPSEDHIKSVTERESQNTDIANVNGELQVTDLEKSGEFFLERIERPQCKLERQSSHERSRKKEDKTDLLEKPVTNNVIPDDDDDGESELDYGDDQGSEISGEHDVKYGGGEEESWRENEVHVEYDSGGMTRSDSESGGSIVEVPHSDRRPGQEASCTETDSDSEDEEKGNVGESEHAQVDDREGGEICGSNVKCATDKVRELVGLESPTGNCRLDKNGEAEEEPGDDMEEGEISDGEYSDSVDACQNGEKVDTKSYSDSKRETRDHGRHVSRQHGRSDYRDSKSKHINTVMRSRNTEKSAKTISTSLEGRSHRHERERSLEGRERRVERYERARPENKCNEEQRKQRLSRRREQEKRVTRVDRHRQDGYRGDEKRESERRDRRRAENYRRQQASEQAQYKNGDRKGKSQLLDRNRKTEPIRKSRVSDDRKS